MAHPASVVVDRPEDFVGRVAELGLEGVVAKRRDSRYLPGRRTTAWLKQKLRCEERLAVTGVRRTPAGAVEAIFVARRYPDGSITGAGSIELGLGPKPSASWSNSSQICPCADAARSPGIRPRCRWSLLFTVCRTARCATRCSAKCWTTERPRGLHPSPIPPLPLPPGTPRCPY
jgi:ATP dependent DNA ligase domain